MKCINCGFENPEDVNFCQNCGTKLSLEKEKKKNNISKKTIISIIAGVVLLAIVGLALCLIFSGKKSTEYYKEHLIMSFYDSDDECTYFTFDKKIIGKITDKLYSPINELSYKKNGKLALTRTESDDLYMVTEKGVDKLASDVEMCSLSTTCEYVYYITNDYILYSINLKNKKIERIADDIGYDFFTLSPDGKTILYYVREEEKEFDEWERYSTSGDTLWAYSKGEYKKIGKDYVGCGVSNDGEFIYVKNEDKALYVMSFETEEKEKIASSISDYYFNEDYSDILFISDSKLYLSQKGKEREKIGNVDSFTSVFMRNPKTFVDAVIVYSRDEEYAIGVINDKKEIEKISNLNSRYCGRTMFDDTVYFYDDNNLYKSELSKTIEKEKVLSGVSSYYFVENGEAFYYVDDENTLRYKKGDKDTVKISDDVDYIVAGCSDNVYFIKYDDKDIEVGTLYCCSDGKNKIRISDDVANNIFTSKNCDVYIKVNEYEEDTVNYSVYGGLNGKGFECILDDMILVFD